MLFIEKHLGGNILYSDCAYPTNSIIFRTGNWHVVVIWLDSAEGLALRSRKVTAVERSGSGKIIYRNVEPIAETVSKEPQIEGIRTETEFLRDGYSQASYMLKLAKTQSFPVVLPMWDAFSQPLA